MDAVTAQKYKHRLVAERDALLAQIDAQRGGPLSRADAASDALDKSEDDNAQIQSGRDVAFAINEHETAELLDIDVSLQRIKAGVYGLCVNCGTHIPRCDWMLRRIPNAASLAKPPLSKHSQMAGDPSLL